MIEDWNDMDLMQRSEFRIRMAKYVTPEVKRLRNDKQDLIKRTYYLM